MFDIGWSELLVVGVIALVVVGPKDLPRLMRIAGQWMGRARAMADQFRRSFDDMARQAELEELRSEVERMKSDKMLDEITGGADIVPPELRQLEGEMRAAENAVLQAPPGMDAARVGGPSAEALTAGAESAPESKPTEAAPASEMPLSESAPAEPDAAKPAVAKPAPASEGAPDAASGGDKA